MAGAHSTRGAGGTFGEPRSSRSRSPPRYTSSYYDDRQRGYSSVSSGDGFPVKWLLFFLFASASIFTFAHFGPKESIDVGLNYSRVFTPSPFFERQIEMGRVKKSSGPVVYSFGSRPPLSEIKTWSTKYKKPMDVQTHHEWALWMNKGSVMNINYEVTPPDAKLLFTVLKGEEEFSTWRDAPWDDVGLYRKNLKGYGTEKFLVSSDGDYYFAFGNLDHQQLQVKLELNANIKTHSTEGSVSACVLSSNTCKVNVPFSEPVYVLLSSPSEPQEGVDTWRVQMARKPRWEAVIGSCAVPFSAVLIIWALCRYRSQRVESPVEETPLMKEEAKGKEAETEDKGKRAEPEVSEQERQCCICWDATKDSFFDPCGHSATCMDCGKKIKEHGSKCPICRQDISIVRKLYF